MLRMACGSERDHVGDLRCAGALGQLQQSQGAQDDPNLLDAAAQQLGKLSSDPSARHRYSEVDDPYLEYAPKQFYIKMVFTRFSGGQRPSFPLIMLTRAFCAAALSFQMPIEVGQQLID